MENNTKSHQLFKNYLIGKESIIIISLIDILLLSLIIISLIIIFSPAGIEKTQLFNPDVIKNSAQTIANNCPPINNREECYKKEFTQLVKAKGIFYSQNTLYALQVLDSNLNHCHVLSHHISNVATRLNPSSWKEYTNKVDITTCGAGFFHGILEARIGYDQNFKITKASIDEICNQGKRDFKESTCNHILGHLLLLENEGNIEPSLPICNSLDNPTYQSECLNGVFMEDSFKPMLVEHGLAQIPVRDKIRLEKQEKRCFNYKDIEAQSCWIDMAEIYSEYYNYDTQKVYASCDKAPDPESRNQCYKKTVVHLSVSPNFNSPEKLVGICSPYTKNEADYKTCLSNIIHSLMYYSAKFSDRAEMLCSNVDQKYQNYCFKDFGDNLKINLPDKSQRLEYCSNSPAEYQSLCLGQ